MKPYFFGFLRTWIWDRQSSGVDREAEIVLSLLINSSAPLSPPSLIFEVIFGSFSSFKILLVLRF